MEQNPPYTAPLNTPTPLISAGFSPVSELLKKAWNKTQKHLLQFFLLSILGAVASVVGLIAVGLLVFLFQTFLAGTIGNILTGVVIIIGIIGLIILMMTMNIGIMMLIAETDPNLSLMNIFKKAIRKTWPLLVVSLLTSLVVLGGGVLLVIPGILFSLLLTFSAYFVVLDGVAPLESMRKSVYVVSKNFGAIFIRLILLFGLGFVSSLIPNMVTSQSNNLVGSLLSFAFNLIFGWFSIGYTYSLFLESKKMAGEGKGKLLWMSIIALIGWLLIVGGGYLIFRTAATNPTTENARSIPFNDSLLDLDTLNDEILATPPASIRPASTSASARPSTTPRAAATPKASAATSSATR